MGLLSYYLIFSCLSYQPNENERILKIKEITLLICAKNELPNLKKNLLNWLSQKEIAYQIIIVNDYSTDGSKEWLNIQAKNNDKLKVLHLEKHDKEVLKGKRFALLKGIECVETDYVVLTDADCYAKTPFWLSEMVKGFKDNTEIVLGYSPYQTKNNFLGKLIDYETILTGLQYLSFAKFRKPYMGVGRNIAYKTAILQQEVFLQSNVTIGGDDDLIVGAIANYKNTEIVISQNSFVYSLPETNFKNWKNQKIRHYNTAKHYKSTNLVLVGLFGVLNVLFYMTLLGIICLDVSFFTLIILYLFKQFLFLITNYKNLKHFELNNIVYRIWYIDFVYVVIFLFFHVSSNLAFRDVWNKK